ncbi:hypothetical protein WJX82_006713 [Trebouxia sp. C0006]
MTYFTLVQGACSHYVWPSERDAYPVSISNYTVRPIRNTQQASKERSGRPCGGRAHKDRWPGANKTLYVFQSRQSKSSPEG